MTGGDGTTRGLLISGRFSELESALCARVAELKSDVPLGPVKVVVGSAHLRTRVGDVLVRELRGVANVEIVTLGRFAADVVARASKARPVLTAQTRERLARRVIAGSALHYFRPVADRPNFPAALAATFADLREGGVDPRTSWASDMTGAAGAGLPRRTREALHELHALYAEYCAALEATGGTDAAGVFAAATAVIGGLDHGRGHTVLYGVYDLNLVQERFVAALLRAGADAFVPLPESMADESSTVLSALRLGDAEWRRLPPASDERNLRRVAAVWRDPRHAAAGPLHLREDDRSLQVLSVSSERGEAREAVREVVAAAEGEAAVPFRECAVVVPRAEDVERFAAELLAAGAPVACRRPDTSDGVRLLRSLADCLATRFGEPFARRAVVDLLTCAPLRHEPAEPGDMALWLDEARQAGVVCGAAEWVRRTGSRRRYLERRVADIEARTLDPDEEEGDGAGLERVRVRLRAAVSLEAAVATLTRAARDIPARADWREWAGAFGDLAARVFAADAAASARDAAGRLAALDLLGEQVGLGDAVTALRELLSAGTVPHGRVGRDGVAVLTPMDLRGLSFSLVVFTGLAEGGFPVRGRPDPLLGDTPRRLLSTHARLGVRLPLAEQRETESLTLFALVCEAARDRLVLVAPRTDASNGRPRLPSRYLLRLASLAAGGREGRPSRPVGADEFASGAPLREVWRRAADAPSPGGGVVWVDARERDAIVLREISAVDAVSAESYLSAVLGSSDEARRRLLAVRASRNQEAPGVWDGLLGEVARGVLAERNPFHDEIHPTGLEKYISCPFAFLVRSVFGLEAPREPGESLDMEPMEFGSLAHAILQEAFERVIQEDLDLEGALVAVGEAWRRQCARAEAAGVTGSPLAWEVRRDMLLDDLRRATWQDPVFGEAGDGRPVAVEQRFGEAREPPTPVWLELDDGRRVRFAGRLDRVDQTARGARIVDYKTGAGSTEQSRVDDGLSVQLPVYQLAVRRCWSAIAPGSAPPDLIECQYRMVTSRGGFRQLPLPGDEEAAQERLRDLVAQALDLVEAGVFARATRGRCEYCDVRYACGVSEWVRKRRREHDAFADLRTLQGPAPKDG